MKPQKMNPRFDLEKCVACIVCVDACPAGTLDLAVRNSIRGFRRYPVVLPDKHCIGCGNCVDQCPTGAVVLKPVAGE